MTIHHDKLAYGKLASTREDLSEQKLDEMLKRLSEEDDKDGETEEKENKKEDKQN